MYLVPERRVILLQFRMELFDVALQIDNRLVLLLQFDAQLNDEPLLLLGSLLQIRLVLTIFVQFVSNRVDFLPVALLSVQQQETSNKNTNITQIGKYHQFHDHPIYLAKNRRSAS